MRVALAMVTLASSLYGACASPGDPPSFTPLISVDFGNSVRVNGIEYAMEFSANGLHLPQSLEIGGANMLATNGCATEGLIGTAVYPAVVAIAGMHGDATRSEIAVLQSGPAVAVVHVRYEVDYQCPGPQTLLGEAHFTLFPNGRIVREDVGVVPASTMLGKSNQCGCQDSTTPDNIYFTSFYAFQNGNNVDGSGQPTGGGVAQACTMYADRAIGVSWPSSNTRIGVNDVASHVFDWVGDAQSLDTVPQSVTSALFLSNRRPTADTDCQLLLDQLADPPLTIGDTPLPSSDHDGIYRDTTPRTSAFDLEAPGVVPSGFAVSVNLGGATHADVSFDPEVDDEDAAFAVQREDGDNFVFVFRDALGPGRKITIEPLF